MKKVRAREREKFRPKVTLVAPYPRSARWPVSTLAFCLLLRCKVALVDPYPLFGRDKATLIDTYPTGVRWPVSTPARRPSFSLP